MADFSEINNNNQILIAFKNKIIIVDIYKKAYDEYKYRISFKKECFSLFNYLNYFELEINNYFFKLNSINLFQIYLEMNNNNIKNLEQMQMLDILKYLKNSPESIFKYTNLK